MLSTIMGVRGRVCPSIWPRCRWSVDEIPRCGLAHSENWATFSEMVWHRIRSRPRKFDWSGPWLWPGQTWWPGSSLWPGSSFPIRPGPGRRPGPYQRSRARPIPALGHTAYRRWCWWRICAN